MALEKIDRIRAAIRRKYAAVAESPAGRFRYPLGREGLAFLHYGDDLLAGVPEPVVASFCGVGNPFSLGGIEPGEAVLDVGCGAGFDLILAAGQAGPAGRACGIDMTPQMVAKALRHMELAGADNAAAYEGKVEELPFPDETFTTVISNGVLNLSPLKERACAEIYRVLKPGGRLQFADIVLQPGSEQDAAHDPDAWSD